MVNPIALPSFVLGYHGCDHDLAERVLAGRAVLRSSRNEYDWLGHGIYFWEHNPRRALEWARELKEKRGSIIKPAVVGAIINLGHCLNLLDSENLAVLEQAYDSLKKTAAQAGAELPMNKNSREVDEGDDLLLRFLDCAVVQHAMDLAQDAQQPIDSVRGVFIEGPALYPNAGFRRKNHIQLCVRNTECIIGYFRVQV